MKHPSCPKGCLNALWLVSAISQCSGELQKSPPGSCVSLGCNAFDSGLWVQAAALQTSRCCHRRWGDLGQAGVGEGRLKYQIAHQGPSQNRCSFHHLMENLFHGHHQRAGSGAARSLTESLVMSRAPLGGHARRLVLGCMSVPPAPGTAGFGGGGVVWERSPFCREGWGHQGALNATSICCHPTADPALALWLLSPPWRAARKQELFF